MIVLDSKITREKNMRYQTHSLCRDYWTSTPRLRLLSWLMSLTLVRQELINYQNLRKTYWNHSRRLKTSRKVLLWLSTEQKEIWEFWITIRRLKRCVIWRMIVVICSSLRSRNSWSIWWTITALCCSNNLRKKTRTRSLFLGRVNSPSCALFAVPAMLNQGTSSIFFQNQLS